MKDVHRLLQVKPVRKTEHFSFNLLNFCFFKSRRASNLLFFGKPRLLSPLAVVPYILAMEFIFYRRKRYFVKCKEYIVGIFILREKPEALYISSLAVAPECRGFGIATYILNYANKVAAELNKNWLELSVSKVNALALRLYKKYGFVKKEEKTWSFILRKTVENH